MSWVQIWIHLVFSTKNRIPFLQTKEIRYQMFQHIKENAQKKDIWLDCIHGYQEHAHCLISLGKKQTISNVARLLKGESSYWINKSGIIQKKFAWQDDYWAVSVSKRHVKGVRNYIYSQEEHHKTISFKEEVDQFMRKHGGVYMKG